MVVLFDIDDTLLDHRAAERAGASALHRLVGAAAPLDAFLAAWSVALDRHFSRYLAAEISFHEQRWARVREVVDATLSDREAERVYADYLSAYEGAWSLFPDVLPCLDRLAGQRLGIISNGQGAQQRRKLARTDIADRFESIVISEECGWAKPSKEIFLHACRLIGASPRDAVYVGDRYDVDAEGARQAGMAGIWLDRRRSRTTDHEPPVVGALDEITALLG